MCIEIKVGISDYKVTSPPNTLITLGLGSCVGIAIYDRLTKVGGLSHIMLPDSSQFKGEKKVEKFADLAIPSMVEEISRGKGTRNLRAKIAGGASMFNFSSNPNMAIGERNIQAVIRILEELKIPIIGQDTGGSTGRTMLVDLVDFSVSIRTGNRIITSL